MTPGTHGRLLVVGAGWLGSAIANAAADRGLTVWSMRRSVSTGESTGDGAPRANGGATEVHTIKGDITHADDDAGLERLLAAMPEHLRSPSPVGNTMGPLHVVLCVSPSRARGDTHGGLYPAAARGATRLAVALGARTLVYTSSTGVYGVTDGSWVTEDREIAPQDDRQRALFDAEKAVLHGLPHALQPSRGASSGDDTGDRRIGRVVLRVAGLYGPSRDPGPRFVSGSGLEMDGMYWCNFAWRDDVVDAVAAVQENPAFHDGAHVFNCADGRPVLARDIARALGAGISDSDPGASGASAMGAPASVTAGRQRITVDRLRETGWAPRVPDIYAGLALLGHTVTLPSTG